MITKAIGRMGCSKAAGSLDRLIKTLELGREAYIINMCALIDFVLECCIPIDWQDGPPGVWGISGEGLFILRELGSTANYCMGAGEQAHTFGDLGSTAKK